jgi:hypothetical protein
LATSKKRVKSTMSGSRPIPEIPHHEYVSINSTPKKANTRTPCPRYAKPSGSIPRRAA